MKDLIVGFSFSAVVIAVFVGPPVLFTQDEYVVADITAQLPNGEVQTHEGVRFHQPEGEFLEGGSSVITVHAPEGTITYSGSWTIENRRTVREPSLWRRITGDDESEANR